MPSTGISENWYSVDNNVCNYYSREIYRYEPSDGSLSSLPIEYCSKIIPFIDIVNDPPGCSRDSNYVLPDSVAETYYIKIHLKTWGDGEYWSEPIKVVAFCGASSFQLS